MSDDSHIKYNAKGEATAFVGHDAVELFRAATLISALRLLKVGIIPTRGLTKTKALALVERYSGKKYKRTEIDQAIADLRVWIATMKAALPTEQEGTAQ